MTPDSTPEGQSIADAEGKLQRLQGQVEAMQALLVRLLQDVVVAESRLARSDVANIVEANQQLVLNALASHGDADSAAVALAQAQSTAAFDMLTGLPNRSHLSAQFVQASARSRRGGSRLALLFLDLDNFKQVNDSHGHALGDRLLRLCAQRMLAAVRVVDLVSRHGGDEFLVLLTDLVEAGDAQAVAEKLIAAITMPADIDGVPIHLSASVGIALFPDDGADLDTLVALADAAMYRSKRHGPGGIAFHGAPPVAGPGQRSQADGNTGAEDTSERRHALLRETNQQLVLAALNAHELKAAAEQVRQRQTAFMAAVADELRNPHAPIRIAAAMLGRLPTDEPLLPRLQGIVERQMNDMSRQVGDLVDAANVDSGGVQVDLVAVDMGRVIDDCVAAHRSTMQQRGQSFDSRRPDGVLMVQGDAQRLAQIVGNLLDNASKHTRDGGRIELDTAVGADTLTMTVTDNGIGITAQMLPQVFDPFVQDGHAIGFNGIGLGIGLTIVRALVKAHGGTLVAHSAGLGRGSRFVVTLPRAADGADAHGPGAAADAHDPPEAPA